MQLYRETNVTQTSDAQSVILFYKQANMGQTPQFRKRALRVTTTTTTTTFCAYLYFANGYFFGHLFSNE